MSKSWREKFERDSSSFQKPLYGLTNRKQSNFNVHEIKLRGEGSVICSQKGNFVANSFKLTLRRPKQQRRPMCQIWHKRSSQIIPKTFLTGLKMVITNFRIIFENCQKLGLFNFIFIEKIGLYGPWRHKMMSHYLFNSTTHFLFY